ncbi:MAG: ATP-binding cassette domain-containing protein [Chloroflexi bacterium]|nr:ATP-binding cassette domain-containing protein [Chloroflexota bacterium]
MAQPGTGYAIETANLTKSFGKVKAVAGLDLKVEAGALYALLGPNGAGKTTTLNLLTTLIGPDKGTAKVAGYDVVKQPGLVRRNIGVTFQEVSLDRNLTGRSLLDIHGRLYQLPQKEIKKRIEQLVELVELQEVLDRPVKTYSGGMKRRLELARGLLTEPNILFLDEPTVGLDPHNRENIWAYLQELRARGNLTIMLTTHYLDEAEKLADKVGIIDEGKLVVEGSPASLIASLGTDIIKLTGSGDVTRFKEALRQQEWIAAFRVATEAVQTATAPTVETKPAEAAQAAPTGAPPPTESVQPGENTGPGGVTEILINLTAEAGRSVKPLVDLAERNGFEVEDVSLQRPTLNEVFFKYTGRRLRD